MSAMGVAPFTGRHVRTCYETEIAGFTIRLQQHALDRFSVSYGHDLHTNLSYAAAAARLGEAWRTDSLEILERDPFVKRWR